MSASRYEFDSAVRGFHEYQSIWAPVVGKELPCKHKVHNLHDSFAVVVLKDCVVVGHLPRAMFWLFLRSGLISCIIIATRRYSRDLVQGGLEVPCTLIFKGEPLKIEKLKGLLKERKAADKTASGQAASKNNLKEDQVENNLKEDQASESKDNLKEGQAESKEDQPFCSIAA